MVNMPQPLVSIIMPAYNAAKYIEEAIGSVLAQTWQQWELLVIDDASTDNTAEVVAAIDDPRIRYIRVERIGSPSGVRNVGLRQAQGELIGFLDADDFYYPQTVETLAAELLQDLNRTAVYGFSNSMDEHGNPMPEHDLLVPQGEKGYRLPPGYSHAWQRIVTGQISCLLAGLMLRRTTLERVGLFNESLCGPEDYEFYIRLFLDNRDGVQCIPQYVYRYRLYAQSLTKDPERYQKVLQSVLRVKDWVFHDAPVPAEVYPYKSLAYVGSYRYLARERLLNHQPALARRIAMAGLWNPHVKPLDWVRKCLPIVMRSLLPPTWDSALVSFKRLSRRSIHQLAKPV